MLCYSHCVLKCAVSVESAVCLLLNSIYGNVGIKISFVYSNGDSKFTVLVTATLATNLVLFTASLVLFTADLVLLTAMLTACLQLCL